MLSGEEMSFHCHNTVHKKNNNNFDDEGNYRPTDVAHCPGAMAVLRKFGRDATLIQIAIRMGVIEDNHYDDSKHKTINPSNLKINKKRARI
jgi:hypothetical protein